MYMATVKGSKPMSGSNSNIFSPGLAESSGSWCVKCMYTMFRPSAIARSAKGWAKSRYSASSVTCQTTLSPMRMLSNTSSAPGYPLGILSNNICVPPYILCYKYNSCTGSCP